MRITIIKRWISPLFVIALFILTSIFSADVIFSWISSLDPAQFVIDSGTSDVSISQSRISTSDKGRFHVEYIGLKDVDKRPLNVTWTIRFLSLEKVELEFVGDQGESSLAGEIAATDLWQHARTIRKFKPAKITIQIQDQKVICFIGDDARKSYPLPDFKIKGLRLLGINSEIEIFNVTLRAVLADDKFEELKSSGTTGERSSFLFYILLLIAICLAVVLIFINKKITEYFVPVSSLSDNLTILVAAAFVFWSISWVTPDNVTITFFIIALAILKFASITVHRIEAYAEKMEKWKYLSLLFSGAFSVVAACFILFFFVDVSNLWAAGISLLFIGSIPFFGHLFSKGLNSNFTSGMAVDGALLMPLAVLAGSAFFFEKTYAGVYIFIGLLLSFLARFSFLNIWKKRIPFVQPAMLLTFVLVIFVMEGALSFANKAGPIPKFGSLLKIDSRWVPEEIFSISGVGSHVFQGQNMVMPKPEDEIRVVFLGGSTTYGSVEEPSYNFVTQIKERLETRFPDKNIKVYNCGFLGFGSFQMRIVYQKKLETAGVDLLVMYTLNNDMYQPGLYTYQEIYEQQEMEKESAIVKARSVFSKSTIYLALVSFYHMEFKGRNFAPAWKILRDFNINIGWISKKVKNQGGNVILIPEMVNPAMTDGDQETLVDALTKALFSISKNYDTIYIDSKTISVPNPIDEVFTDNVHLTANGNAGVANLIYPAVEKVVLEKLKSGRK